MHDYIKRSCWRQEKKLPEAKVKSRSGFADGGWKIFQKKIKKYIVNTMMLPAVLLVYLLRDLKKISWNIYIHSSWLCYILYCCYLSFFLLSTLVCCFILSLFWLYIYIFLFKSSKAIIYIMWVSFAAETNEYMCCYI